MKQATVRIEPETFELTKARTIVGVVSFALPGYSFPGQLWSDFPVRLLGWWTDEIRGVIEKGKENTTLMFMDGPYQVNLSKNLDGSWKAECVERRKNSHRVTHTATVNLFELLADLVNAGSIALERCDRAEWRTEDTVFLRQQMAKAKRILARLRE